MATQNIYEIIATYANPAWRDNGETARNSPSAIRFFRGEFSMKSLAAIIPNETKRPCQTTAPAKGLHVFAEIDINPHTWKNTDKTQQVNLDAEQGSDKIKIAA